MPALLALQKLSAPDSHTPGGEFPQQRAAGCSGETRKTGPPLRERGSVTHCPASRKGGGDMFLCWLLHLSSAGKPWCCVAPGGGPRSHLCRGLSLVPRSVGGGGN